MNIKKYFHGHCPHLEDEHVIEVDYIDNGDHLKRGLAACSENWQHNCPYEKQCPLRALAPEIIKK